LIVSHHIRLASGTNAHILSQYSSLNGKFQGAVCDIMRKW